MRPIGPGEEAIATLAAYDYLRDGQLTGASKTLVEMALVNRGVRALDQFAGDLEAAAAAVQAQPAIDETMRQHFASMIPMYSLGAYNCAFAEACGDFDRISANGTLFTCRNGVTINSVALMVYFGKSTFQIVQATGLSYNTVNGVRVLMKKAAFLKVEHMFGLPITNPRTPHELGLAPDPVAVQSEADARRAVQIIKFVLIFGAAALFVMFWKAYA